MLELYVRKRDTRGDWRSGTLDVEGAFAIRAVLPDGSVFSCDVPADGKLVLEVTEHPAEAQIAVAAAVAAPDPAMTVVEDPTDGLPRLEPIA